MAEAVPAAPEPGEAAWSQMGYPGSEPWAQWNPDDLPSRQGAGVYRRMVRDDQIRALLSLKRAVVASRAWHFQARDEAQRQCAEFLEYVLTQRLRGTFRQALEAMLSSQVHGFSLVEKVYEPVIWRGRSLWGLAALKARPAETFRFESDRHGNLTGLLQQQNGREERLEPRRFIHHVNKAEVHPHYGESDLRECHRHFIAKEHILNFWNVYLERMASGFVHGRISGPLGNAERDELKRVLQRLSSQSSIITPAGVELSMVTAPDTDAFEKAVAARDKAIAKALLVPNLLGFSEQGAVGSYSQSRTQQETFFLVMNSLSESLADTLNEHLFRELAWWNFGLVEPPRFIFDPHTEAQRQEMARAWQEAVSCGAVNATPQDEARLRALLGFPAGEAG